MDKLYKWCANFSIFAILVVKLFFFLQLSVWTLQFFINQVVLTGEWQPSVQSACVEPNFSYITRHISTPNCTNGVRTFEIFLFWWLDFFYFCNWVFKLPNFLVNQVVLTGERWHDCLVNMYGTYLQLYNSPHQYIFKKISY